MSRKLSLVVMLALALAAAVAYACRVWWAMAPLTTGAATLFALDDDNADEPA